MDRDVMITLRLLKSGGKDFNLKVTRYTNSQNPLSDRDFHANDDVQVRLQNASFNTKLWYEKRREEFRGNIPEGIRVIPNFVFANAYLAYERQAPVTVFKNNTVTKEMGKDLLFLSHEEHPNGLYEWVFNDNTRFEAMLCSMYLLDLLASLTLHGDFEKVLRTPLIHHLALFKVIFSQYVEKKYPYVPPVNKKVKELVEKGELATLLKVFKFIDIKLKEVLEASNQTAAFLTSENHYNMIKDRFASMEISIEDIDNIPEVQRIDGNNGFFLGGYGSM
jgi:hypothetical protein